MRERINLSEVGHITIAEIVEVGASIKMTVKDGLQHCREFRDSKELNDKQTLFLVRIYNSIKDVQ